MIVFLIPLILAGQPSFAKNAYETVGRRFTFLPLAGFSTDDGPGGGFRLTQFDYDGVSIPYSRAISAQGFFTTKGKWAHQIMADFPQVAPGRRLELSLRFDKEETANFFGDLTDEQLTSFTREEQTFQQIDVYIDARWIRTLARPWQLQWRLRGGTTFITPHAPQRNVIEMIAPLGYKGGHLVQLGASLRYDTRDDYTNSTRGRLEEVGIEWAAGGGGNFNGGGLVLQHRHFKQVYDRIILAQRLLATYNVGEIPFYELPKLGSSRTLRGLSADRFRDEARLLLNTELRWLGVRISDRRHMFAGLNLFADIGQVFPNNTLPTAEAWRLGVGAGMRFYWYSMVVRADYGRSNGGSALYMRFSQIF